MKKLYRILISVAVCVAIISAFTVSASAATLSDGIVSDMKVLSQTDTSADVKVTVTNFNANTVSGINYSVSVSDNATVTGTTQKTDVEIDRESSDTMDFTVSIASNEPASTTSTSANTADSTTVQPTTATTLPLQLPQIQFQRPRLLIQVQSIRVTLL